MGESWRPNEPGPTVLPTLQRIAAECRHVKVPLYVLRDTGVIPLPARPLRFARTVRMNQRLPVVFPCPRRQLVSESLHHRARAACRWNVRAHESFATRFATVLHGLPQRQHLARASGGKHTPKIVGAFFAATHCFDDCQ